MTLKQGHRARFWRGVLLIATGIVAIAPLSLLLALPPIMYLLQSEHVVGMTISFGGHIASLPILLTLAVAGLASIATGSWLVLASRAPQNS